MRDVMGTQEIQGEKPEEEAKEEKPKEAPKPAPKPKVKAPEKPVDDAWAIPDDLEIIDSYEGVQIAQSKSEIIPIYMVMMPELTEKDLKTIKELKDIIMKESHLDPSTIRDPEQRKEIFSSEVKRIMKANRPEIPQKKVEIFTDMIVKSMIGYGMLDPLLSDDALEELMVIGVDRRVYVAHRKHGMCSSNVIFRDDEEICNIISRMAREVGRRIDTLNPLLDCRLIDGSRVNATIRPITPGGATLTIRKFREDPLTVIDLIKFRTMTVDFAAWLWFCVDGMGVKPANAVVAGGTGSGKTTTLNSLACFIPERDRVITIEDTMELQLKPHKHWIQMETRPANVEGKGEVGMDDCVVNTLRMRPDRVIVGEVRGPEARTLFTAMNTGHDGCMGSLHANDARETITRLTNAPMSVPMIMMPALDLIVMQNKFKHPEKGNLRRITEVAEIGGFEGDVVQLNRIFEYDAKKDELVETGTPSQLVRLIGERGGMDGQRVNREVAKRALVLKYLLDKEVRDLVQVKNTILEFNRDTEAFIDKITEEM